MLLFCVSLQVKLLEAMEVMDQETFDFKFGEELVYTTLLSDGRLVELLPGGSNQVVRYQDRREFIHLVQKARLEESRHQVRRGFQMAFMSVWVFSCGGRCCNHACVCSRSVLCRRGW